MQDTYISRVEQEKLPVTIISCREILWNNETLDKSEDQEEGLSERIYKNVTTERLKVKTVAFSNLLFHLHAPV